MSFVPLGEIVEIKGGGTPDKAVADYWNGDIPWASVKDFKSTSLDRTTDFITPAGVKNSATNIIPAGTIIVPTRMAVGKAAISTIDLAINQDLKALFPKKAADTRYLLHALLASSDHLERNATGATVKGITLGVLRGLKIPLPPLPEQRRIAGILDQADALRRLRRQSLSRLSDLGQAIFYEMFGDLVTNPNGWPEKAFRDLATRITVGIVVKPASYYREAGVPAIRGTNIKLEGIDLSDAVYFSEHDNEKVLSKTRVWTDDLVIVRSGRPGLAALVPPEMSGINSIDVLILTPDKDVVVPRFVKDLINSPMGKRLILSESRGQVQQHFNVGSLSKAKLFLPPYDLQLEYLSRISAFDEAAARRSESEEMLDSLFASLQHRAFRGEL